MTFNDGARAHLHDMHDVLPAMPSMPMTCDMEGCMGGVEMGDTMIELII